jgi:hypothetical protein
MKLSGSRRAYPLDLVRAIGKVGAGSRHRGAQQSVAAAAPSKRPYRPPNASDARLG